MRRCKQGLYTVKNPDKYIGNVNKVRYMSSWELNFHRFLDMNVNILQWSSETIIVPYIKPTDGRIHKYYVDYWVKYRKSDGDIHIELIEVKPLKETQPPRSVGKNKKRQLYEQITWAINSAKWEQAALYAKKKGWTFRIVTERELFK